MALLYPMIHDLGISFEQMNTGPKKQRESRHEAPFAPSQQEYSPQGHPTPRQMYPNLQQLHLDPQQLHPPPQQQNPPPQQLHQPPPQWNPDPQQWNTAPQQLYPPPQQLHPSPQQFHPPPQQWNPAPQQGHPPQQGFSVLIQVYLAPEQCYTHQLQQGYTPQGLPQMAHPGTQGCLQGLSPTQGMTSAAPPQPQAPTSVLLPAGFEVLDGIRPNNIIVLISASSGHAVAFEKGKVQANAMDFSKFDAQWNVIIESNGSTVLQNVLWPGCYLAITKKGTELTLTSKKDDKECQFFVTAMPDNYVTFESVTFPGSYMRFSSKGTAKSPKELIPADRDAKFLVRVMRQRHSYSNPIFTPYGFPSVFMKISDLSVVQLYCEHSNRQSHLAISGNGDIISTPDEYNPNTFFIWKDRGMGIVSLQSRKYDSFRFRMARFKLMSKGNPDVHGDFRLIENSDGSVKFESVTCPGGFLGIPNGPCSPITNISIYLVTIQKCGESDTITKSAIN